MKKKKNNEEMQNKEEMNVDEVELMKQLRKRILDSENFCKVEIIVGEDEVPYVNFQLQGRQYLISRMLMLVEKLNKDLQERFSAEYLAGKLLFNLKDVGKVELENGEQKSEDD